MTKLEILTDTFKHLFQREFHLNEALDVLQRTNQAVYWSWGCDNILYLDRSGVYCKGILLRVNAHHHNGLYVLLILGWNDTYSFFLIGEDNKTVIRETHDVYFDELQERIDKQIEYIDDYEF